jgi:hypothetical protein
MPNPRTLPGGLLDAFCRANDLDAGTVRAEIAEARRVDEARQRARLAEAVRRDDLAGHATLPPFFAEGVDRGL